MNPSAPLPPWQDTTKSAAERATALLAEMTLREKVGQLCCTWLGVDSASGIVAPHQDDMENHFSLDDILAPGLGQLTRPFGTAPVEPLAGAKALEAIQRTIVASNRFGIPAMSHEECLAGFTAWQATCYPVPLAWGATFNPPLIREMAQQIGALLRSVGAHQGLAPVLDVSRDLRWGRTEETIAEDPYLVGTIATSYVQGLQSAGIVATLKHFAGYSTTRAARNLAPASLGRRELADVIFPPFELAVIEGQVGSIMNAYNDIDGVPVAASSELLTGVLRDQWGFSGTVVADYFSIGFLKLLHGVAETWGDAARLALIAGIDVEMPNIAAYGDALIAEVEAGRLDEAYVDRAALRVLTQKAELGLLDPDWDPTPPALRDDPNRPLDFDPPQNRAVARQIAAESVVLVRNAGLLPLSAQTGGSFAVIGPVLNDPLAMLGCYSFPSHVGINHPQLGLGLEIPTMLAALRAEFPQADIVEAVGCPTSDPDRSGIPAALELAKSSDQVFIVVGDRAGLFGKGTSGEGCDARDMALPGVQAELLEALLDLGLPTTVIVLSGRPYCLGTAPQRAQAIVQAFFPGEEGAGAIAGVLSGRINPSGRLPVSIPTHPGPQPSTYLAPPLANASKVSMIDPTPAYGFGHGLSYGKAVWSDFTPTDAAPVSVPTDGEVSFSLRVSNPGQRALTEVVQVYLHDPVASVVQPVQRLIGYARVELPPTASKRVRFTMPVEVANYTGLEWKRIVDPGALEVRIARSSSETVFTLPLLLTGPVRELGLDRARHLGVEISAD
jgi:beta-xylosidase